MTSNELQRILFSNNKDLIYKYMQDKSLNPSQRIKLIHKYNELCQKVTNNIVYALADDTINTTPWKVQPINAPTTAQLEGYRRDYARQNGKKISEVTDKDVIDFYYKKQIIKAREDYVRNNDEWEIVKDDNGAVTGIKYRTKKTPSPAANTQPTLSSNNTVQPDSPNTDKPNPTDPNNPQQPTNPNDTPTPATPPVPSGDGTEKPTPSRPPIEPQPISGDADILDSQYKQLIADNQANIDQGLITEQEIYDAYTRNTTPFPTGTLGHIQAVQRAIQATVKARQQNPTDNTDPRNPGDKPTNAEPVNTESTPQSTTSTVTKKVNNEWLQARTEKYKDVHKLDASQENPINKRYINFKQDYVVLIRKKPFYSSTAQQRTETITETIAETDINKPGSDEPPVKTEVQPAAEDTVINDEYDNYAFTHILNACFTNDNVFTGFSINANNDDISSLTRTYNDATSVKTDKETTIPQAKEQALSKVENYSNISATLSKLKSVPNNWKTAYTEVTQWQNAARASINDYYDKRNTYAQEGYEVTFANGKITFKKIQPPTTNTDTAEKPKSTVTPPKETTRALTDKQGRVILPEDNYLRAYQVNNFINISINTSVHQPGTCSVTIKGAERVICADASKQSSEGWFHWSDLVGGWLNINEGGTINDGTGSQYTTSSYSDNEHTANAEKGQDGAITRSSNRGATYNPKNDYTTGRSWKRAQNSWSGVQNGPFDTDTTFRTLFKTREAKYGWRFAEKCDWEPMDEILVFGKSLTLRVDDKELDDTQRDQQTGILLGYQHNNTAMFKMEPIFFGYIEQVNKTYDASRGCVINITAKDHLKLLELTRVLASYGNVAPGAINGIPALSSNSGKYGMLTLENPLLIETLQENGSKVPEGTTPDGKDKSYDTFDEKNKAFWLFPGNSFVGWYADEIVQSVSARAGVPDKFLVKRVEPFHQFTPFLAPSVGGQQDIFSGQSETALSVCRKVAEKLMLEFFADEEGHIVLKIPNWVLRVNMLQLNNCNIKYKDYDRHTELPQFDIQFDDKGMPYMVLASGLDNDTASAGFGTGLMELINDAIGQLWGSGNSDLSEIVYLPQADPKKVGPKWVDKSKLTNDRPDGADGGGGGSSSATLSKLKSLGFDIHSLCDNTTYAPIMQAAINDLMDANVQYMWQLDNHTIAVRVGRWYQSNIGSLYNIAQRYYGSGRKWQIIAECNDIADPTELVTGQVIKVPFDESLSDYLITSSEHNDFVVHPSDMQTVTITWTEVYNSLTDIEKNNYNRQTNEGIKQTLRRAAIRKYIKNRYQVGDKKNVAIEKNGEGYIVTYDDTPSPDANTTPHKEEPPSENPPTTSEPEPSAQASVPGPNQEPEKPVPPVSADTNEESDQASVVTFDFRNDEEKQEDKDENDPTPVSPSKTDLPEGFPEALLEDPLYKDSEEYQNLSHADREKVNKAYNKKMKAEKRNKEAEYKEAQIKKANATIQDEALERKANINARNKQASKFLSGQTDQDIPALKSEYIISFTLMDSDQDVYNYISIGGANLFGINDGNGKDLTSTNRCVAMYEHICQFGLRAHPAMESNVLCGTPDMCELMGAMLCYKSLANRYKAVVTAIDDSAVKVGNPIRMYMYDEHPFRNSTYLRATGNTRTVQPETASAGDTTPQDSVQPTEVEKTELKLDFDNYCLTYTLDPEFIPRDGEITYPPVSESVPIDESVSNGKDSLAAQREEERKKKEAAENLAKLDKAKDDALEAYKAADRAVIAKQAEIKKLNEDITALKNKNIPSEDVKKLLTEYQTAQQTVAELSKHNYEQFYKNAIDQIERWSEYPDAVKYHKEQRDYYKQQIKKLNAAKDTLQKVTNKLSKKGITDIDKAVHDMTNPSISEADAAQLKTLNDQLTQAETDLQDLQKKDTDAKSTYEKARQAYEEEKAKQTQDNASVDNKQDENMPPDDSKDKYKIKKTECTQADAQYSFRDEQLSQELVNKELEAVREITKKHISIAEQALKLTSNKKVIEYYQKVKASAESMDQAFQTAFKPGAAFTIIYSKGKITGDIELARGEATNTAAVPIEETQPIEQVEVVEGLLFDDKIFKEQAVFYIESMSRNIDVQNVSTMTLQLRAGRMMGQASCYDIMSFFYDLYYQPWQSRLFYYDKGGNNTAIVNPHMQNQEYEKSLHAAYRQTQQSITEADAERLRERQRQRMGDIDQSLGR